MHKNTAYRIHCQESYCGGLRLVLLSGTELLRRGEEMGDIYSCMFNANGRRLLRKTEWSTSMDDAASLSKLERQLRIAVKRAELKKLDKDEQEKSASGQLKPPKKALRTLFLAQRPLGGNVVCAVHAAGVSCICADDRRHKKFYRNSYGSDLASVFPGRLAGILSFDAALSKARQIRQQEKVTARISKASVRQHLLPDAFLCSAQNFSLRRKATDSAALLCHNGQKRRPYQ